MIRPFLTTLKLRIAMMQLESFAFLVLFALLDPLLEQTLGNGVLKMTRNAMG